MNKNREWLSRGLLQHTAAVFSQCPNRENVWIRRVSYHAIPIKHSHYFLPMPMPSIKQVSISLIFQFKTLSHILNYLLWKISILHLRIYQESGCTLQWRKVSLRLHINKDTTGNISYQIQSYPTRFARLKIVNCLTCPASMRANIVHPILTTSALSPLRFIYTYTIIDLIRLIHMKLFH